MGDWRGMDTLSQYPIPGDIWGLFEYCFLGTEYFVLSIFFFSLLFSHIYQELQANLYGPMEKFHFFLCYGV